MWIILCYLPEKGRKDREAREKQNGNREKANDSADRKEILTCPLPPPAASTNSTTLSPRIKNYLIYSSHLPCYRQIQQTKNCWYFSYFSKKIGPDTSCKLSPREIICMKCQILFLGKIRKIFQNIICWNFYPACKVLISRHLNLS